MGPVLWLTTNDRCWIWWLDTSLRCWLWIRPRVLVLTWSWPFSTLLRSSCQAPQKGFHLYLIWFQGTRTQHPDRPPRNGFYQSCQRHSASSPEYCCQATWTIYYSSWTFNGRIDSSEGSSRDSEHIQGRRVGKACHGSVCNWCGRGVSDGRFAIHGGHCP